MNKFFFLLLFIFLDVCSGSCQTRVEHNYALSKESVKRKKPGTVTETRRGISGVVSGKIVIYGGSEGMIEKFMLFDEKSQQLSPFLTLSNKSDKVLGILVKEGQIFKKGFMSIPEKYREYRIDDIPIDSMPYQDIWIQDGTAIAKIDTYPFHYIDKAYDSNFSMDGRYLIVNPYTDITAGYWPEDDDRFYIYDLIDLKKSHIKKQTIKCEQCMNTNMIGDRILFVKEIAIGGGQDGYYKNIYIAPKDDIKDTLKIAHDINIIKISPDGKFILGEKYLHGEYTAVIIDIASKRFQYLLGRNYPMSYSFYSPYEKKFAFDFGTHFVYIDFPETYPFDALSRKVNRTSKTENADFWKKYQHEPMK